MIYYAHAESVSNRTSRAGGARVRRQRRDVRRGRRAVFDPHQYVGALGPRGRDRGTVLPVPRGGGWYSPVDIPLLHALLTERPDRTTEELTRAYNQRAAPEAQVHRSSVLRALQRTGYVFKKNGRGRPSKTAR